MFNDLLGNVQPHLAQRIQRASTNAAAMFPELLDIGLVHIDGGRLQELEQQHADLLRELDVLHQQSDYSSPRHAALCEALEGHVGHRTLPVFEGRSADESR